MMQDRWRYLRKAPEIARYVATDPIEVWLRLQSLWATRPERRRPHYPYEPNDDWEPRLHESLGASWPCEAGNEFWPLWHEVISSLEMKGLRVGVGTFHGWNDAEPEFARAVWCLTRHLRPANVVETGVARGVTTRIILEALARNGRGHLWSIDLPPPLEPKLHEQIGAAVEAHSRDRWSYVRGSSRRRLPAIIASLGKIDLFVHDSIHTEYNTRFELERAWSVLGRGGAMVADDIDLNWCFGRPRQIWSDHLSLLCRAEPLQSDPSRFEGKGLFAIVKNLDDRARQNPV